MPILNLYETQVWSITQDLSSPSLLYPNSNATSTTLHSTFLGADDGLQKSHLGRNIVSFGIMMIIIRICMRFVDWSKWTMIIITSLYYNTRQNFTEYMLYHCTSDLPTLRRIDGLLPSDASRYRNTRMLPTLDTYSSNLEEDEERPEFYRGFLVCGILCQKKCLTNLLFKREVGSLF